MCHVSMSCCSCGRLQLGLFDILDSELLIFWEKKDFDLKLFFHRTMWIWLDRACRAPGILKKGGINGQVAMSALGSGCACPTAFIGHCPLWRIQKGGGGGLHLCSPLSVHCSHTVRRTFCAVPLDRGTDHRHVKSCAHVFQDGSGLHGPTLTHQGGGGDFAGKFFQGEEICGRICLVLPAAPMPWAMATPDWDAA